jgi:hypothetical protein
VGAGEAGNRRDADGWAFESRFSLAAQPARDEACGVKIKIPQALKDGAPPTLWGRVLNATPIVMTVIATMLAGLSSSEMTKAQYDRSLAAQHQSKAGDQWAFFQAKRMRSAVQLGTLDVVQTTVVEGPLDQAGLHALVATLPDPAGVKSALTYLLAGRLPEMTAAAEPPASVKAALEAVERGDEDAALAKALNAVSPEEIAQALRAAQARVRAFDAVMHPIVSGGDRLGEVLEPTTTEHRALSRDFAVLRLRYSSLRYDAEARLNQAIANLYELQVRQGNISAERHHRRSQRFFLGMLAAQAAVILATFAMAAQRRSALWIVAAAAGLGALLFAVYVYVYI